MNWSALSQLIRLRNQTGTLLLMLPTLWALVMASAGQPPFALFAIFATGAFLMRSAGVVLNDLADRAIDRQVQRTKDRPLANGSVAVPAALALAGTLVLLAAGLLLFLNRLTVMLSPIALMLAALYPFSKRFIQLPQAILGIAFGWGVVMAWAATRNALDQPVWLLFAATVCWAITYDSIYAIQDRDDDTRVGVKSAAILFGSWTWLAVAVSSLSMVILLGLSGWMVNLNPAFYALLGAVGGFLGWQVWRVRGSLTRDQAFALFKQHVGVGAAVLGAFWVGFQ